MPNIKSAKKRVLITKKKNARNRSDRSKVNNAIKAFNKAIDSANIDEAERLLPITMSIIDKGVTAGIMHKNAAANKKSALSKRLSDIKSGKVTVTVKKDNKTIAAEKARAAKEARDAARAEFHRHIGKNSVFIHKNIVCKRKKFNRKRDKQLQKLVSCVIIVWQIEKPR